MTIRIWLATALAALTLSACEDATRHEDGNRAGIGGVAEMADDFAVGRSRAASAPSPSPPPPAPGSAPADGVVERLIAYRYDYRFETPADTTPGLVERHQNACTQAGAQQCQIVSANIYDDGRGSISASVQLRASPAWVETFRSGLEAELETAGGRIQNQSQSADDLTSAIYDMEARLEAKRVLRTRLISLLERETASVEELVQVERELANVQGEIEGAEAQIRVMRGRVSMSALGLNYASRVEPVSPGAFDPLTSALTNVFRELAAGLANVITFIAGFAPWLLVIVPLFWLLSRWLRGLFKARREAKTAKAD
ncbi:DUF4349 domain-containing protein [Maricaulis salignorans]|uniref:DUF4349 domain-containing protein n=1 Tax=Maricaulis salignorans TaxID=144026 RepID=UPI003A8F5A34